MITLTRKNIQKKLSQLTCIAVEVLQLYIQLSHFDLYINILTWQKQNSPCTDQVEQWSKAASKDARKSSKVLTKCHVRWEKEL